MRHIIEIFFITGLCASQLNAGNYCYRNDDHPMRAYATKTAYTEPPSGNYFADKPQGCTARHIWLLARHGTRYVSADEMERMEAFLLKLREDIMNNMVDGSLCPDDLRQLRAWTFRMEPENAMSLSDSGWKEVRGLGRRLAEMFPSILGARYNQYNFELRHSNYSGKNDRTKHSAQAFADGAFGFHEGVKLVEQEAPDWLIHYYKNCDLYVEEVASQPIEEYELFKQSELVQQMIRDMELRLGFDQGDLTYDEVDLLYDVCRVEQGVYDVSPWCAVFTEEALSLLEYGEDVKYYWSDGYGREINYEQACPLVKNLVDNLKSAINNDGKKFVGIFGHSVNSNSFLARLGLFRDSEHLRGAKYAEQHDRKWQTTKLAPMTGNTAVILYQCDDEYSVQVYLNEKLITLPGCDSLCPFGRFIELYGDIAEYCDVEEICNPPTPESDQQNASGCGRVSLSVSFLLLMLIISLFS